MGSDFKLHVLLAFQIKYFPNQGGRPWQAFGGGKMAMKPFVKRVFTIFATNASFLRVISNFRI